MSYALVTSWYTCLQLVDPGAVSVHLLWLEDIRIYLAFGLCDKQQGIKT